MRSFAQPFGFLDDLVNVSDHIKSLLGKVVMFSLEDFLKSTDRFRQGDISSPGTGKLLGHKEGLGKKSLNPSCPGDDQFVLL